MYKYNLSVAEFMFITHTHTLWHIINFKVKVFCLSLVSGCWRDDLAVRSICSSWGPGLSSQHTDGISQPSRGSSVLCWLSRHCTLMVHRHACMHALFYLSMYVFVCPYSVEPKEKSRVLLHFLVVFFLNLSCRDACEIHTQSTLLKRRTF